MSVALQNHRANNRLEELDAKVREAFPTHPFEVGVRKENLLPVLEHYLGMSVAFPFVQAGAIGQAFQYCVEHSGEIDSALEMTSVVGAFLVWDEFGAHSKLLSGGMPSLPSILGTESFHSNLLRQDILTLTNKLVKPSFRQPTQQYLLSLSEGLSHVDPMRRVAYMTAFELHASRMITSLWESVSRATGVDKASLAYFETHVGGDDPAEGYHVEMTQRMLGQIVCAGEWGGFIRGFEDAYAVNIEWCENVTGI